MALEYDLTKVADSTKALWKDESRSEQERDEAWATTAYIIHWCMAVEIGEITEENVADWWTRYRMVADVRDPKITLESVYQLIGLETNVFTVEPARWFEHLYARQLADSKRALGVIKS